PIVARYSKRRRWMVEPPSCEGRTHGHRHASQIPVATNSQPSQPAQMTGANSQSANPAMASRNGPWEASRRGNHLAVTNQVAAKAESAHAQAKAASKSEWARLA